MSTDDQVIPHVPPAVDWDPRDADTLRDQGAAYDAMRARCPVARSDYLGWSLFSHADVMRVITDHETFSNAVSAHLSVPNGMDPPEHTKFRVVIDQYYTPERMATFEPECRRIAGELVESARGTGDLMSGLARTFALEMQSAFLGWPASLHEPLRAWTLKNHRATLARDREAMAEIALEFDGYIRQMLEARRGGEPAAAQDITAELMHDVVDGRPLTDEEIVSILRNWTVGELSTIASSVGIMAHHLATHPELQDRLRAHPEELPVAIDEMLRIHAPLIANRRVTTRDVEIGGRTIPAGERLTVLWASANRDEAVFGDPDEFRTDRDPADNLLYGAGVHVCPGAPLARLEMRVMMEELLARTTSIALVPGDEPELASYPASGFTTLPLTLTLT